MTQSELDSMPVGWSHNDYHARMVKISDDQYALYDNYGNSTVGSGQWLCAMTGNVPGVLSSIAGTYTGGALGVWPPQPTITTQEKKELEQLEEDRKAFISTIGLVSLSCFQST
jgi:hypothetical protein